MYRTLLSILYCTMHCTMLYSTHTKAALYIVCETKARLQRPSFEMKSLPYSQFWVRPDSTCTNYWNYEITMLHIGKLSNYLFFLLCLKCSALGDDVMIREDGAPRPNVQVNILLGRHQDVDAVASNTVTAVHQMTGSGVSANYSRQRLFFSKYLSFIFTHSTTKHKKQYVPTYYLIFLGWNLEGSNDICWCSTSHCIKPKRKPIMYKKYTWFHSFVVHKWFRYKSYLWWQY